MRPFSFVDAASVAEAASLLLSRPGAALIAGGSDLLGLLKEGIAPLDTLVSIERIERLRGIEATPGGGLRLGALVTLTEMETGGRLTGPYALLAEAARSVATPEVRNQGTLGGNLCQRPRCLHFRQALVPCLKKGGADCPAAVSPFQDYLSVFGGDGCYAVNASDVAPPLVALEAVARIEGSSGARDLPLEAFFRGPHEDVRRETCLAPGEVLTEVLLPPAPAGWRGLYSKGRERTAGDFPIVSLALGFALRDGVMRDCRFVLGGVAPTPRRSREAEAALEGRRPSDETALAAAAAALAGATPLPHNAHKLDLARALTLRALQRLGGGR